MKYYACIHSPIGWLHLEASDLGLERISMRDQGVEQSDDHFIIHEAISQLTEFFDGTRKSFNVPLHMIGTHFQLNVWEELQKIPFAVTNSYEDIARRLGDVKVIRAAATANGRNPIPIIIPCHRVIGKDGSLTGYSGGLHRKKWLLEFEHATVQMRIC
ncbi:MAG: methylated-DNA--[protein]-cysteine S-methyltransferase [Flavobacteriales bacterium]